MKQEHIYREFIGALNELRAHDQVAAAMVEHALFQCASRVMRSFLEVYLKTGHARPLPDWVPDQLRQARPLPLA